MPSNSIVIIGSGVLGLSTAVTLQQRLHDTDITILAKEFPYPSPCSSSDSYATNSTSTQISKTEKLNKREKPSADYASMWAGAHYRPIPPSSIQLLREQQWAFKTASKMLQLQDSVEAGIKAMPGLLFFEDPPEEYIKLKSRQSFASQNDIRFKVLEPSQLPPGVKFGCEYDSYCINVHVYCRWLLDQFVQRGGRCVQAELNGVIDAFGVAGGQREAKDAPIVVNCSGRNFDSEKAIEIQRGQTVLVRNEYHRTVSRVSKDGVWSFLIPRPQGGGTIVGGTKESGDWEDQARQETRRKLLENAAKYFPDFVESTDDFDVVQDNVGRRPGRDGGVRVEIERLTGGRNIVHGYGVGGRGYELSWGIAEDISNLVELCIESKARL